MKSIIIVLLALVAFTLADISVEWAGNVTLSGDSKNYDYRQTFALAYTVPGLLNGAGVTSINVDRKENSVVVDALAATAFQSIGSVPPIAWLAWVDATVTWVPTSTFFTNFDASAAANFIAKAIISLSENKDGQDSNIILLKNLIWTTSSLTNDNNLHGITLTGTTLLTDLKVEVQFLVPAVKGKIQVEGGDSRVVVPKSIETIIKVSNFPFKDSSSKLKLTFGIITGSANVQADGTLTSGSGNSGTYFTIASTAVVDGKNKKVSFEGWSEGTVADFPSDIQAKLSAKYGASASAKLGSILVPQGQVITWDPAIGSGEPPKTTLSAGAIVGIVIAVLVVVAIVTLIVVFIVKRRRR